MARLEGKEVFQAYLNRNGKKRPDVLRSSGFMVSGEVFQAVVDENSGLAQENVTLRERIVRMEREAVSLKELNKAFINAVNAFSEAPARSESNSVRTETPDEGSIVDVFPWEYSEKK